MSRYQCHGCQVEHGTDNVVAYCASCYSASQERVKALESANKELEGCFEMGGHICPTSGNLYSENKKLMAALKDEGEKRDKCIDTINAQVARAESAEARVKELEKFISDSFAPNAMEHQSKLEAAERSLAALVKELEEAKHKADEGLRYLARSVERDGFKARAEQAESALEQAAKLSEESLQRYAKLATEAIDLKVALAAMERERDAQSARADRWVINEGFARRAVEEAREREARMAKVIIGALEYYKSIPHPKSCGCISSESWMEPECAIAESFQAALSQPGGREEKA